MNFLQFFSLKFLSNYSRICLLCEEHPCVSVSLSGTYAQFTSVNTTRLSFSVLGDERFSNLLRGFGDAAKNGFFGDDGNDLVKTIYVHSLQQVDLSLAHVRTRYGCISGMFCDHVDELAKCC